MEFDNSPISDKYKKKDPSYFQCERHEMLAFVPQDSNVILDVGCGAGNFAQTLKLERNAEVWGIELDQSAGLVAAQKIDKVIIGNFNSKLDIPKYSFDCIVFNDVLEHLEDPYSALSFCKELLTNKGVIIASIPNVRYFNNIWDLLVHKNWEYTEWGILDKTHLRFFTYRSIISMFKKEGYQVELIKGINPLEKVDPHQVKKFKILNLLLCNNISDMRYLQFAVVAKPINFKECIN